METHVLGFPRIGANRELKKATERYWKGEISSEELLSVCDTLKQAHWEIQKKAGLSFVATGDFSLYDHVLDTSVMLGAIPERFQRDAANGVDLAAYFRMARGDAEANIPAMEMTKWFDTNYHYIVPEWHALSRLRLSSHGIIEDTRKAFSLGYRPKPVLLGPITYLSLIKDSGKSICWDALDAILAMYSELIARLAEYTPWIQIDEPILCTEISEAARSAFLPAYKTLNSVVSPARLLLATYFGVLEENLPLATGAGCAGLHLDLVRGKKQLADVMEALPDAMTLSLGLIDGRNIWKTDLCQALKTAETVRDRLGMERLMIGSSCSLLHCPVDLDHETEMDPELKNWMAFAKQKCQEITLLGKSLCGVAVQEAMGENRKAVESRRHSRRVHSPAVQARCTAVSSDMFCRKNPYPIRKQSQAWLKLPLFPTTTIGSFPQTSEIRKVRLQYRRNEITRQVYEDFIKQTIREVVVKQEALDLDVLVHGEPERNDMVEYFGQQMDGFCFTENGWVQSYGTRCVKPPIIFGDVSRPKPMTVDWITYAQSLTSKPMKGMLTGPVTILCWSFVRDDMDRSAVCQQIAMALRDEIVDLEQAGIGIIQIDEAALREGLPIRKRDAETYLRWAVDAFRLATAVADDRTQIHTHMCYSEFNTIIEWIAAMDADVISIESSRSKMALLSAFESFEYPNEIGPGIYDIHSPRIPSVEEIVDLLNRALVHVPQERLWVNPDCGLKTRAWPETMAALENMVSAARHLRTHKS